MGAFLLLGKEKPQCFRNENPDKKCPNVWTKPKNRQRTSQQILRPSYIPLGWTTLTRPKNVQTSGQIYRKELNAMDNLFRHLKRNSKQMLSFMLAFVVLMENPVSAYASTATSSDAFNIKKPVVTSTETTTQTNTNTTTKTTVKDTEPTTTNFNPDTYTGEPFYFDENGNVIYDSEDEELQEIREQIAESLEETDPSDYSDIAWTFDEYPLTTMNTTGDSDIATYVAGVDDAAYAILGVAAAAAGVYVGKDAIKSFASNQFEPWVRRTFGNDSAKMKTLQDWLDVGATSAAISFTGMKSLTSMVNDFLGTATWEGNKATFQSGAKSSRSYWNKSALAGYLGSVSFRNKWNRGYYHVDVVANLDPSRYFRYGMYGEFEKDTSSEQYGCVRLWDGGATTQKSDGSYNWECSSRSYPVTCYWNYLWDEGYYSNSKVQSTSYAFLTFAAASSLGHPIFKDATALQSYLAFGTQGGRLTDTGVSVCVQPVTAKKTWPALRSNFFNNYTPSDTITLPSSSSAIERLLAAIYASDTADEVVSNINSVWKITKNANTVLTAEEAYSNLQYVLAAIATSLGASVTTSDIDEFIDSYYSEYVDGAATANVDKADAILKNNITIEGGGNNGDPDNNNKDNNKYKVIKKLVVAFDTFLLAHDFVDILTDFGKVSAITANISVDAVADTVAPTPGTGTDTDKPGSGDTTANDYTGLFGQVISILSTIASSGNVIASIYALMQTLPTAIKENIVDGFVASPIGQAIQAINSKLLELSVMSTALGNIASWNIDAWINGLESRINVNIDNWGAVVQSGLAMLTNIDFWKTALDAALEKNALTDAVVSIQDKAKTWDIDIWSDAVGKAVGTAIDGVGLGSLAGTLEGIKDAADANLAEVLERLKELAQSLDGLSVGIDLGALADTLKAVLEALGLGSIAATLENIEALTKALSIADVIALIKALPASIVAAIAAALPEWKEQLEEDEEEDNTGDGSLFGNILNILILLIAIIIALLVLFINCLCLIINLYKIPASTALFNDDVLKGLEFLKSINIPFPGTEGIGLLTLLMSCVYFVLFASVIATLRKKIEKFHV